jgi:hypothetical protein
MEKENWDIERGRAETQSESIKMILHLPKAVLLYHNRLTLVP